MEKIVISDLNHKDILPETAVFEAAGIPFARKFCKTQEDVIRECAGARVILNQRILMDRTVFEKLPGLECVIRYGVGVDNINLEDAKAFGVRVCNVPDYGTREVADHALALMMALVRRIPLNNNNIRAGVWDYRPAMPIRRLSESTVGIVGLGRIGSAFAERVHALGCRILAFDPAADSIDAPDWVTFVSFEKLLAEADVISVHAPLVAETHHLFNEETLYKMKPGSFLVNAARGGIVNEAALARALAEGQLAGAALDVTETEPLPADSPLLKFENFIVSPHIAWYSEESSVDLKRKAAEEAVRVIRGEPLRCPLV